MTACNLARRAAARLLAEVIGIGDDESADKDVVAACFSFAAANRSRNTFIEVLEDASLLFPALTDVFSCPGCVEGVERVDAACDKAVSVPFSFTRRFSIRCCWFNLEGGGSDVACDTVVSEAFNLERRFLIRSDIDMLDVFGDGGLEPSDSSFKR